MMLSLIQTLGFQEVEDKNWSNESFWSCKRVLISGKLLKFGIDQIMDDSLGVNPIKSLWLCWFFEFLFVCLLFCFVLFCFFLFFFFLRQLSFWIDICNDIFFFLYCQSKHPTDLRLYDPLTINLPYNKCQNFKMKIKFN